MANWILGLYKAPVDVIYDFENGCLYGDFIKVFKRFIDGALIQVVIYSRDIRKLALVPEGFSKIKLNGAARGNSALIDLIQQNGLAANHEIFILGCKDFDFFMSQNSSTFLLSAEYAIKEKEETKKLQKYAGIKIHTATALDTVLGSLINIKSPWFFQANLSPKSDHLALIKAHTRFQNAETVLVNNAFDAFLKHGMNEHRDALTNYFLLSCYTATTINLFKEINIIGVYPSANCKVSDEMLYLAEKLRFTFKIKKGPYEKGRMDNVLVRHKETTKRHQMGPALRDQLWADDQFESMILNSSYRGKLEGQKICILDDYSTNGPSVATARHLLERAGASKVLFVTIGKFNEYTQNFKYSIEGDIFSNFSFTRVMKGMVPPESTSVNNSSHTEKVQNLYNLLV